MSMRITFPCGSDKSLRAVLRIVLRGVDFFTDAGRASTAGAAAVACSAPQVIFARGGLQRIEPDPSRIVTAGVQRVGPDGSHHRRISHVGIGAALVFFDAKQIVVVTVDKEAAVGGVVRMKSEADKTTLGTGIAGNREEWCGQHRFGGEVNNSDLPSLMDRKQLVCVQGIRAVRGIDGPVDACQRHALDGEAVSNRRLDTRRESNEGQNHRDQTGNPQREPLRTSSFHWFIASCNAETHAQLRALLFIVIR